MVDVCPHCGKALKLSGKQEGTYSLYMISYMGSRANEDFKHSPFKTDHYFTQANAILELKNEAAQHVNCLGYFNVPYKEWSEISAVRNSYGSKNHNVQTFLTQTGYLLLVKTFTDKLAWQIQRELVGLADTGVYQRAECQ